MKYERNKIFFTSDLHLFHDKVIGFCDRPYKNIDEMHKAIRDNWNMVVPEDGIVFILGDLHFGKANIVADYMETLNGTKHWILGNHDHKSRRNSRLQGVFESIELLKEIKVKDIDHPEGCQRITLCHYAMKIWNSSQHKAWQLYGHSHGTLDIDNGSFSMDVGVDSHKYRPISYQRVKIEMKGKTFCPVDCHEPKALIKGEV